MDSFGIIIMTDILNTNQQHHNYFNSNKLLAEQQFDFHSQHSTEVAALKLVDNIIRDIGNARQIKILTIVFLFPSKALDALNFNVLLH